MKLTPNRKRILRAFARTSVATQRDLKNASPHWRTSLAALMTGRLVESFGQCYALTKDGAAIMPEVLEDDLALIEGFDNVDQA
jgi:predicted transcriptional regulator